MAARQRPLLVVGLGGNAISPPGGALDYAAERHAVAAAAAELATLVGMGYRLLVVHGNGPQVGRLLDADFAAEILDIHVAQTQGELGYLLAAGLSPLLNEPVSALMTRTLVDAADPALAAPDKPVGPLLACRPQAPAVWLETAGAWRRVVASPRPLAVLELEAVRALLDSGHVVAGGGGGVAIDRTGAPVLGVVDKDRVAALLALALDAQALMLATDVDAAYRGFGTPAAAAIRRLDTGTASAELAAGTFAPGSMGPKVEAALAFAEGSGRPARIAAVGALAAALADACGTRVG
ncbi:MAG: carbamate kinase [Pseudomonadales bacterium]